MGGRVGLKIMLYILKFVNRNLCDDIVSVTVLEQNIDFVIGIYEDEGFDLYRMIPITNMEILDGSNT